MHIDYLNSAKLGDVLTGKGRIVRAGKTVLHAEAGLYTAGGKFIAKASSNLIATTVAMPL